MADVKITALPAITAVTSDDLLLAVNDPGGSPTTNKITVANFLASFGGVTGAASSTDGAPALFDGTTGKIIKNSTPTGSGNPVLQTSPTLTTPVLGVATATSINKVALTAPTSSATLTIADGKTLTVSNILTLTGTDSSSVAFGTGGTVTYTSNNLSVFAATTSAQLAGVISDETGSGALVFANSPVFTTPNIGSATGSISGNAATVTTNANLTGPITSSGNATSIASQTGTGTKFVVDTSPTLVTPVLGVAAATSINFGGGALSTYIPWTNFTPTVTLVGGSDTVPVYSTNTGRYSQIGNIVYVQVYLTGDGGNEGSGTTGQMNIALPVTAGASQPTYYMPAGTMLNSTVYTGAIQGQIAGGATTIALGRNQAGAFSNVVGNDQNNATRTMRITFFYEV